jgi:geranyl-CoA carboxylase alpha subunit
MNKILIANRGEIAVRIIRTAQSLGYDTVAVFSDADEDALHADIADQAIRLGGAAVGESYLNVDRIIAAACRSGADAIHPGYGFLSENSAFAQQVIDAGMTWIGPSPEAMEVMGNKAAAKAAVADSDVPVVPGYFGEDQSDDAFVIAANSIGYPVMVKAAAGGGGRGMRLVRHPDDFPAALTEARSESLKAFKSDELLLEKAIVNPRHIELQIFADQHGNTLHLGERDCSIQRRHQKVIEEAPSPAVSPEMRERMGAAAVAVARSVNYTNAGTVEFLVDEDGRFYFIEMNTRLQVEHPVTELITGYDLVEWQLLVAEGHSLPVSQHDVELDGHAIEVRLYAESPANDFLPCIGTIHHWSPPTADGVRIDHGLKSGQNITPFYDAMIAKVITHGSTRLVAQRRLQRALEQTFTLGVETNRSFLLQTLRHPVFMSGSATTSFIQDTWDPASIPEASSLEWLAAAILYTIGQKSNAPSLNNWAARPATFCFAPHDSHNTVCVEVHQNVLHITQATTTQQMRVIALGTNQITFERDGLREDATFVCGPDNHIWIQFRGTDEQFTDSSLAPAATVESRSSGKLRAPMPGSVLRIDVSAGDTVEKGQPALVLEAMKMEQTIECPISGTVSEVLIEPGQQVTPRQLLVVIEPLVIEPLPGDS